MTLIPELERELDRAVQARGRRRSTLRFTLGIPAALLIGTTAALAAGGVIPIGAPAKDPIAGKLKPHVGIGTVTDASVRVLPIEAPDPDGGPPWGLRLATTSRGLGCLQAARLVDGRLGVLGRDRAFGDDGRFHPIPQRSIGHPGTCAPLDANGRLITNVAFGGIPASASTNGECAPPQYTTGVPASKLCDPRSVRILYYGLLGPQAESISLGSRTVPLSGEDGAYLIVERVGKARIGGVGTSPYPMNGPITAINFKDGSSCPLGPAGPTTPDHQCANPGYAAPTAPRVGAADVRTPIRITKQRVGKRWKVRIRFRARVPVTDARSSYSFMLSTPSKTSPGRRVGSATQRDIKAGETVVFKLDHLMGHGVYHGEVTYQQNTGALAVPALRGVKVGSVRFRLP